MITAKTIYLLRAHKLDVNLQFIKNENDYYLDVQNFQFHFQKIDFVPRLTDFANLNENEFDITCLL